MNGGKSVTSREASLAFAIAVVVDLIQIPANLATLTGALAIPMEVLDLALDTAAALLITRLLGFHWALVPTFAAELIPVVDVAPTWTACVAYVVSRRKHEGRYVANSK